MTSWTLTAVGFVGGSLLVAGFATPIAGAVTAAVSLAAAGRAADPLLAVTAVAVALLGPGAFSVDARLFGRREIVLPRSPGRRDTRS